MADPRMNSIHLPASRRILYRQAREALVGAQGYQTLCAFRAPNAQDENANTLVGNASSDVESASAACWLVNESKIYPLNVGINTVGRSSDNDVIVEDAYVSRRHCAILVHATSGCDVYDTASRNGTYVNADRITGAVRLVAGDEIRICSQQFIFQTASGSEGAANGDATLAE